MKPVKSMCSPVTPVETSGSEAAVHSSSRAPGTTKSLSRRHGSPEAADRAGSVGGAQLFSPKVSLPCLVPASCLRCDSEPGALQRGRGDGAGLNDAAADQHIPRSGFRGPSQQHVMLRSDLVRRRVV